MRPSASDVPVRVPGTRARSGNAMARTRSALLEATAACLARYGIRKTTMVDVASRSGVAKATLYNHFRTKEDLIAALVEERVQALVAKALATAGQEGLAPALTDVAAWLADDPALRRAATEEPALLAPLAAPGDARAWTAAREGVAAVLAAARVPSGPAQVELVLRWVTSQLWWPAAPGSVEALVSALGAAPAPVASPQPAATTPGVGWPGA
jgi:AcrR family transcriptional regulator